LGDTGIGHGFRFVKYRHRGEKHSLWELEVGKLLELHVVEWQRWIHARPVEAVEAVARPHLPRASRRYAA